MSVFRFDDWLELVPVVHGSASYASELRRWLLDHPCDALAVPLPSAWKEPVLRGIERLPAVSMVVQVVIDGEVPANSEEEEVGSDEEEDASWLEDASESKVEPTLLPHATYVPIDPCQAVISALRFAVSERLPIEWIDPDSPRFEWESLAFPDPYALERTTLDRFCSAMLPALPPPTTASQHQRIVSIAAAILELRGRYQHVIALCHLQEWPWVRAAMRRMLAIEGGDKTPQSPGNPSRSDTRTHSSQASQSIDQHSVEENSVEEGSEIANFSIDPRSHLFVHGELPFITGLYERARHTLETEEVWTVEGLKELFVAARSSYRQDLGNRARQITPLLISQCLKYIRNQTLLECRMTPSFYTIVRSAQQMMGDAYAVHLVSSAKDYAFDEALEWSPIKMGIDRAEVPGFGLVSMVSRLPGDPMEWRTLELNRPPKKLEKKKWSSRWNPYQQCSWPEEDQRIESFRHRIIERARSVLGADLARTEKFTTSMMDGLDLRETLRHWYDGSLHVKITPPSIGHLDATIMIFDPNPDPREYSWRSTWFAEHADESTLAFYATPFTKEMLGPGVAASTYGGAMFLYPPRPIEDIWSDPRLDFTDTLEQRLVAGACMHAQSRHVALLSPVGPGMALKKIAKRFSRRLIHVPLSHFADSVVQQLRLFHVLNGKHVRSYAAHFIRKS